MCLLFRIKDKYMKTYIFLNVKIWGMHASRIDTLISNQLTNFAWSMIRERKKMRKKRLVQLVWSCFLPKERLFSVSLYFPPEDQSRSEAGTVCSVESVAFIYSVVGFPPAVHGGGPTVKSVGSYNTCAAGRLRYLFNKEHLKHFLAW